MIPLRALAFATVLVTAWTCALAEPGPPPDPQRGESYDGRRHGPTLADDLRLIPRLVLAPLRLLWRVVSYPVRWAANGEEKHHISEHVLAALTSDDGQVGVRPEFSFASGFTPNFGATFFDHKLFGPATGFDLTLTGAGPDILFVRTRLRPTHAARVFGDQLTVAYTRRNDQLFTGIGGNLDSPLSRYAVDAVDVRDDAQFILSPLVAINLGAMFGFRRFGNGTTVGSDPPIEQVYCVRDASGQCVPGTVDPNLVPGFNSGTQFLRGWVALRVDSRDSLFRPSSGGLLELSAEYSHGVASDSSSYFRFHGAITGALDLWRRSRILLLRVAVDDIEPTGDAPVPFSELTLIGGPSSFRGFRIGRLRDFSSVVVGAEFRWPVWMWMDAVLFGDYGGVFASHFSDFSVSQLHPDVGFGLRVRTSRMFIMRFELAYGWGDGLQIYLSGSAFP